MNGLVTSRSAVDAASCMASLATRVLWYTCTARYNTDKTTASEPINCEMALIASQFTVVAIMVCFRASVPRNPSPQINTDCHRLGEAASNLCSVCVRGPGLLPLLRFVANFKNYFTARVTSRYLFLRFDRLRKWKRLRHGYLDFPGIDEFADLGELF